MSHFSVLVIHPTKLTVDALRPILQPWHEYECTGVEDQYVVNVDVTVKARKAYADRQPNNSSDFTKFCAEYGEWSVRDGRVYDWTNPNARWDWWMVGGRWRGMLLGKQEEPGTMLGDPGTMGNEPEHSNGFDIVRRGNLDIDTMRDEAEVQARLRFNRWSIALHGHTLPVPLWDDMLKFYQRDIEKARKIYTSDPRIKALQESALLPFFDGDTSIRIYNQGLEAWIAHARAEAFTTFAVVKDGQWYERGKMGWWGMSSDDMLPEQWQDKFATLIDDTPAGHWLAVVDAHI